VYSLYIDNVIVMSGLYYVERDTLFFKSLNLCTFFRYMYWNLTRYFSLNSACIFIIVDIHQQNVQISSKVQSVLYHSQTLHTPDDGS
jgi:hypothetical protein